MCKPNLLTQYCTAYIKLETLKMEYNPVVEVLNDKTNKQELALRQP